MSVSSSEDYALFVDGVAWQPIESTADSDRYIIASGGRFVFYDAHGNVAFSFYNQYTADFSLLGDVELRLLNSEDTSVALQRATRTYVQVTTVPSSVTHFSVTLVGNYTSSSAAESEPNTNNGETTELQVTTSNLKFGTTDGDLGKYTIIKLGNVLLAFIAARN